MKRFLVFAFLFFSTFISFSQKKNVIDYSLPDSVKAVSFLSEISVGPLMTKKEIFIGIKTDLVKLSLKSNNKEKEILFEFPSGSQIVATGVGVFKEKRELNWRYNWKGSENYKLMIATAGDSVGNFSLYSGYIFLPSEKKWKLIGACKIKEQWKTIKQPAVFIRSKGYFQFIVSEAWCQRQNGSWKNMLQNNFTPPVINLYSHVDSLEQLQREKVSIEAYIGNSGRMHSMIDTSSYKNNNDVNYALMKEGTGKQVTVNDTVTAFYKGYLLNGAVFDETKERPATFPLNRLIRGWQIGVPLCKVGGKIKLIIPSNLAYSIRTRAAKIPPNSILVFEIEVVDAKSPQ